MHHLPWCREWRLSRPAGPDTARESKDSEAPANRNTVRGVSHSTGGGTYITMGFETVVEQCVG